MIKNLSLNLSVSANAGSYYTIRTGIDDNVDRSSTIGPPASAATPNAVPRASTSYLGINYSIGFGKQSSAGSGFPGGRS